MREEIKNFTDRQILGVSSDTDEKLVTLEHFGGSMTFVFSMKPEAARKMSRALMDAADEIAEGDV